MTAAIASMTQPHIVIDRACRSSQCNFVVAAAVAVVAIFFIVSIVQLGMNDANGWKSIRLTFVLIKYALCNL